MMMKNLQKQKIDNKNKKIVKSKLLPTIRKDFGPGFAGRRPVKGGFKLLVLTF